jgi:phage shock protein A
MRFLERMALLLKADAHGVIDQLEERSLLAKQHLREAELELTRKRARLEALEEEERCLAEDAARLEARVRSLDEDVELALAGEQQELARFAVRRLLPERDALRGLRARSEEIRADRARIAERLEEQERELEELRSRVRARLAVEAREEPRAPFADPAVADEEVELELLRRRTGGPEGGSPR